MSQLSLSFYDFRAPYTFLSRVTGVRAGSKIVVAQCDRFDEHTIVLDDIRAAKIASVPLKSRVRIEQEGLGTVAWAIYDPGTHEIAKDGTGNISLTLPNVTEELTYVRTGLGYADATTVGEIVSHLGAVTTYGESKLDYSFLDQNGVAGYDSTGTVHTIVTPGKATGWSARFVDNAVPAFSAAPVTWNNWSSDTAPTGNTITKKPDAAAGWTSGATGLPFVSSLAGDYSLSWQMETSDKIMIVGISHLPAWGQFSVDFGFYFNGAGGWQVFENGALPTGTGSNPGSGGFTPTTYFALQYTPVTNKVTYFVTKNGVTTTYVSTATPIAPLVPMVALYSPGAQAANVVAAGSVPQSQQWWRMRSDNETVLGAAQRFAKDTSYHIRQAVSTSISQGVASLTLLGDDGAELSFSDPALDRVGDPLFILEVGPFGEPSGLRLIDGTGGDAKKLSTSAINRVIDRISQTGPSARSIVNLITPLGGGNGDTQVSLGRLWRILNDPKYPRNAVVSPATLPQVFPEYNTNYTIHRVANGITGYEYYMRSVASIEKYGEMQGGGADSQFTYTDKNPTDAVAELTERGLYAATIGKFRRNDSPATTIQISAKGVGRPPRGGQTIPVDYNGIGYRDGVPVRRLRVNSTFYVMKVERTYGEDEDIDDYLLSDKARYDSDSASLGADTARQVAAIQLTAQTTLSLINVGPLYRQMDANLLQDHSVSVPQKFLSGVTSVREAYLRCEFISFRAAVKTSENSAATINIAIPTTGVTITTPTQDVVIENTADVALSGTGFNRDGTAITGTTDGFDYIKTGTDYDSAITIPLAEFNSGGWDSHYGLYLLARNNDNRMRLGTWGLASGFSVDVPAKINFTKAITKSAFSASVNQTVAKAKTLIGQIRGASITGTIAQQTITAPLPLHTHAIVPEINDLAKPALIQLWIDTGGGAQNISSLCVDQLSGRVGPYSGTFEVEVSRFLKGVAGKTVKFIFISIAQAGNNTGLGEVCVSGTIAVEYGGASGTYRQQQ